MPSPFKDAHLLAPLPLRLAVGAVFIWTGFYQLFRDIEVVGQSFGGLGIPLPTVTAVVVGIIEFFGGIAVILGLWTRWISLLQVIILIVAIWLVKLPGGLIGGSADRELLLLAGALALFLLGSGRLSIDRTIRKKI